MRQRSSIALYLDLWVQLLATELLMAKVQGSGFRLQGSKEFCVSPQ